MSNDEQLSGEPTPRSWDEQDEYTAICESIDEGEFEMNIGVTVLQMSEHYFTLGMVSDKNYWISGQYETEGRAKGALTRLVNRSGGENYKRLTFDEYQAAIRAMEA